MTFLASVINQQELRDLMDKALINEDDPYWGPINDALQYIYGPGEHPDKYAPDPMPPTAAYTADARKLNGMRRAAQPHEADLAQGALPSRLLSGGGMN